MSDRYRQQSSGMAVLELAVVVVILAVIIAGGVYVMDHRSAPSSSTNSTAATTAQPGTTAGIAQLTQNDAQSEQQVDKNADSQTQNDALSANAAANNVGGAYNESTL